MTQITEHFSTKELERSDTAVRLGIKNEASPEVLAEAKALALNVLEPLRKHFGVPVKINSWYRCEALERVVAEGGYKKWLALRGRKDSAANWAVYFSSKQHPKGQAADIVVPGVPLKEVFEFIKHNLKFDQMLLENNAWIHVSYRKDGVLRNVSNGAFKA